MHAARVTHFPSESADDDQVHRYAQLLLADPYLDRRPQKKLHPDRVTLRKTLCSSELSGNSGEFNATRRFDVKSDYYEVKNGFHSSCPFRKSGFRMRSEDKLKEKASPHEPKAWPFRSDLNRPIFNSVSGDARSSSSQKLTNVHESAQNKNAFIVVPMRFGLRRSRLQGPASAAKLGNARHHDPFLWSFYSTNATKCRQSESTLLPKSTFGRQVLDDSRFRLSTLELLPESNQKKRLELQSFIPPTLEKPQITIAKPDKSSEPAAPEDNSFVEIKEQSTTRRSMREADCGEASLRRIPIKKHPDATEQRHIMYPKTMAET